MPLRVLVTGGTGLLGRQVLAEFDRDERWSAVGTALSRYTPDASPALVRLDLTDVAAVEETVRRIDPQVIVHCAAERRPDVCETRKEFTHAVNVASTALLARLAKEMPDTFLLYVSTDYVFDGTAPPYKPNATPHPLNAYGVSKQQGEAALWQSGHNGGVLRIPILYGKTSDAAESAVTVLLSALQVGREEKTETFVDNYHIRYPTYASDVATALKALADRRMRHCSLSGTWHFSSATRLTKYDMVRRMAAILAVDDSHVSPNDEAPSAAASRPYDCHMDTSALSLMGLLKLTDFDDAMREVLPGILPHCFAKDD